MTALRIDRRSFTQLSGAALVTTLVPGCASLTGEKAMYGLIGKMTAKPGQRDAFIAILLRAIGEMPGCLSYVVARDPNDPDGIWITEVWDSKESHAASLSLPAVREAIAQGRALIAGFGEQTVTEPVGGYPNMSI
jgi:quinol monooxygenase YgiN